MIATLDDLTAVVKDIDYLHPFRWGVMGDGYYIQIIGFGSCAETGEITSFNGRKWYISRHATEAEVVQTALAVAIAFEEHEVRERFRWKGRAIFGPHYDLQALTDACEAGRLSRREEK